MKGRILTAGALALSIIGALSCQRRELTEFESITARVRINADWSSCMNTPDGMTVIVYSQGGREYLRRVSAQTDGIFLDLPQGIYRALVFSYSESEWSSLKLYDTGILSRASARLTDLNPSVISSGITEEEIVVTDENVTTWQREHRDCPEYTAVCRDLVMRLEARIHFKGAENLRSISLDISGMAAEVLLSSGVTGHGTASQTLSDNWVLKTAWHDPTEGTASTSIRTLGLPSGCLPEDIPSRDPALNKATLHLLLRDGITLIDTSMFTGNLFRVEETPSRLDFKKTEKTLILELGSDSPIVLPEVVPENGVQSGFQAEVLDWQLSEPVEIDII